MGRRAGYTAVTVACLLLSAVAELADTARSRIVCLKRRRHRPLDGHHYVGNPFCVDCSLVMDDTDYQCKVCGTWYVVRVLARDCERKHEQEAR